VREPKLMGKSYVIPKRLVWDAWLKVKENGGAAGADGVTIEQVGEDLSGNLYRLRHRPVGPDAEGGCAPHRPALGAPLRGAVAESAASTGGRQPGRARLRNPSGFCDSPLLANLFMHYAFDCWMARTFPAVQFERYCDDIHCPRSKRAAGPARAGRDRVAAGRVRA
jgi:hypothetical protein